MALAGANRASTSISCQFTTACSVVLIKRTLINSTGSYIGRVKHQASSTWGTLVTMTCSRQKQVSCPVVHLSFPHARTASHLSAGTGWDFTTAHATNSQCRVPGPSRARVSNSAGCQCKQVPSQWHVAVLLSHPWLRVFCVCPSHFHSQCLSPSLPTLWHQFPSFRPCLRARGIVVAILTLRHTRPPPNVDQPRRHISSLQEIDRSKPKA